MFGKRDWMTVGMIGIAQIGLILCYWAVQPGNYSPELADAHVKVTPSAHTGADLKPPPEAKPVRKQKSVPTNRTSSQRTSNGLVTMKYEGEQPGGIKLVSREERANSTNNEPRALPPSVLPPIDGNRTAMKRKPETSRKKPIQQTKVVENPIPEPEPALPPGPGFKLPASGGSHPPSPPEVKSPGSGPKPESPEVIPPPSAKNTPSIPNPEDPGRKALPRGGPTMRTAPETKSKRAAGASQEVRGPGIPLPPDSPQPGPTDPGIPPPSPDEPRVKITKPKDLIPDLQRPPTTSPPPPVSSPVGRPKEKQSHEAVAFPPRKLPMAPEVPAPSLFPEGKKQDPKQPRFKAPSDPKESEGRKIPSFEEVPVPPVTLPQKTKEPAPLAFPMPEPPRDGKSTGPNSTINIPGVKPSPSPIPMPKTPVEKVEQPMPKSAEPPVPVFVSRVPAELPKKVRKQDLSPWKLQLKIVQGRSVLTARTDTGAEFLIRCDHLAVKRPNGDISAKGNVQIVFHKTEAHADELHISWQNARVDLKGNVRMRSPLSGPLTFNTDQISLRLDQNGLAAKK